MATVAHVADALTDRQSIRLNGWDYSSGWYFVTINTTGGYPFFGTIVHGRVLLNDMGRLAEACWREIPAHFPEAHLDEFVVMPNHIHGLVQLVPDGARNAHPLGDIVGAYKAAVSRVARRGGQLPTRPVAVGASPMWHRNYWDVIVRDKAAMINIRQYIRNNPVNYEVGRSVAKPQFLGDPMLFDLPKLGFLASRGGPSLPVKLPIQPGEAVISGFLSPMERQVFSTCLRQHTPIIWVIPFGVNTATQSPPVQRAMAAGHLLLASPFDGQISVPNVRRAAWCNEYVLAHCNRMVIGHLNPSGMLACILSEADPDKTVIRL